VAFAIVGQVVFGVLDDLEGRRKTRTLHKNGEECGTRKFNPSPRGLSRAANLTVEPECAANTD
jgi:hypothetical protein